MLGIAGRAASYAPTYWVGDLTGVSVERADDGALRLTLPAAG